MKRLGAILADQFCQSLSGGDRYFEQEPGDRSHQGSRVTRKKILQLELCKIT